MKKSIHWLLAATAALVGACGGDADNNNNGGNPDAATGIPDAPDEWEQRLGERQVDYNAALRIAALRLTGELPTLEQINQVVSAGDINAQKVAYEAILQQYLAAPAFTRQMLSFWRDSFKMGGNMLDTAPAFATQLTVENRSYLELFTAITNNCPTVDANTGAFTPANCNSGAPQNVGVLSNPEVMRHFYGNFAFRRVKWLQEAFLCTKFPAEYSADPQNVGNPTNLYTGKFPFQSIAGLSNGGRIDFLDTAAVICANCHSTMNHQAPLFANFNMAGMYQANISVQTPIADGDIARLTDYLPTGETTQYRLGQPAPDLAAFGAAMAADPAVAECAVARVWNWALGKADIVDASESVPSNVITSQVNAFKANGHKMKDLVFAAFTSDDFVKF